MTENVYVGKAAMDAAGDRGWLLGHFKPVGDLRHSKSVVMTVRWPSLPGYAPP